MSKCTGGCDTALDTILTGSTMLVNKYVYPAVRLKTIRQKVFNAIG